MSLLKIRRKDPNESQNLNSVLLTKRLKRRYLCIIRKREIYFAHQSTMNQIPTSQTAKASVHLAEIYYSCVNIFKMYRNNFRDTNRSYHITS